MVLPGVLCGREEHRLGVCREQGAEKGVGAMREEVTTDWRKLCNENLICTADRKLLG